MRSTARTTIAVAGIFATALALTACSAGAAEEPATEATIGAIDLSDVCPANIGIQTDWNPEAEHGHLYELLGPDPVIDAGAKSVTGTLYASGEYTGVNVTIQSGGPAIGFQTVSSQLYSNPDMTLGYVSTDEAISVSDETPSIAVFAPLEKNPLMIMWDPESYPDVESIEDLGKTDAIVRYFGGSAYMDYLTGSGILKAENTDGSYDGTPANFVAAGGKDAQQGFASAEPYIYENEVADWGKPVAFQLIHDAGFPTYAAALSVKSDRFDELSTCLEELVPVLQKAELDYYADPAAVNTLILQLVEEYDTGWVYSEGVADFSVQQQVELGLVGNGDDATIGNFEPARVQELFDLVTPIYAEQGNAILEGITADSLYTNEFIDESIGF